MAMIAEKEEEREVREEEKFGIRIIDRHPSQSRLAELGIRSWPKWGCPPGGVVHRGKFALKYDAEETCYIVKGKVRVCVKGSSEYVELGAGDLAVIPKGLSCTWDVSVAVDKHYTFDG